MADTTASLKEKLGQVQPYNPCTFRVSWIKPIKRYIGKRKNTGIILTKPLQRFCSSCQANGKYVSVWGNVNQLKADGLYDSMHSNAFG